ncbi:MAG: aspartate carbamoyltransferase [Chloroflexi bacterium RBG_13_46_9]|jgi:aspartate carbamoyltransferase catalytic subunit|nr:MAG: aspartate carbamoyltransferase [Chloroflexi bacterium RBG_13_46_9]
MTLKNRDLITIDDLTNREIEAIFSSADAMSDNMPEQYGLCRGKVMASLFFEPSTRTRLSFETAMNRLGGRVITVSDPKSTSLSKGESIADMARIVAGYADIIVIRHPWEGAAKLVADYANVPVINAGDGGHQHPSQTLCDLYTLQKERGDIHGLKIALWGDLKYGRTTHSLIFALAKFGATIVFCPSRGLEVPENVLRKLVTEYGGELERFDGRERKPRSGSFPVDAVYMTPGKPHQLAMMPDIDLEVEMKAGVDALYVTRPQKERFTDNEQTETELPVVDKKMMRGKEFRKTLVMHPLPRVDELAYDLDADPRSMYFKQAARGVPIRMALLSLILGVKEAVISEEEHLPKFDYPLYQRDYGVTCSNARCVTLQESEKKYLKPGFKIVSFSPLTFRCVYCEHGTEPKFIASSEWHEGKLAYKYYHRSQSHWTKKIRPENLIAFDSEKEAEQYGFKPAPGPKPRAKKEKND